LRGGFFKVLSVEEFASRCLEFPRPPAEDASLAQADGRFLAADVISPEDLPAADRSCMDGYAVRARDTFGASESNPAYLECVAELAIDEITDLELAPGQCAAVVTGGRLPAGADGVVMVEHTGDLGAGSIEVRKAVAPHDNVMLRGEDARAGQPALAAGTAVRPQEIGLLAALGISTVLVGARPRRAAPEPSPCPWASPATSSPNWRRPWPRPWRGATRCSSRAAVPWARAT
jgi:molybdopterin molybdotransferase